LDYRQWCNAANEMYRFIAGKAISTARAVHTARQWH
jgi:hypothetical protein